MIYTSFGVKCNNVSRMGIVPAFLSAHDPRPMAEQLNEGYEHGGGWVPSSGFTLKNGDVGKAELTFAGEPPMFEYARATMRDETLIMFDYSFFAIVQNDGSFEVCRMD